MQNAVCAAEMSAPIVIHSTASCYQPETKLWECIFSQVSVLFKGGPHAAITHDALRYLYPSTRRMPDMAPTPPTMLTSGGHHWRPVETCSLVHLRIYPNPPPERTSSDDHQNT